MAVRDPDVASARQRTTLTDGAGSNEIGAFVTQLAREYLMDEPNRQSERRSEPRYRITLPVILEPVDGNLQPKGIRFRGVTRDISESGVGLICQDPVSGTLKMEISSPSGCELCIIAEVTRCESVGYYYNVGCVILKANA